MEFKEINIPADLAGLSSEAFNALRAEVNEAGRATAAFARTADGDDKAAALESLAQLREAKAKLEVEGEKRDADTAEAEAVIAEAEAEFTGEDDDAEADADAEDDEAGEDEEEADADADDDEAEAEAETEEAVTASAKPMKIRAAARQRRAIPEAGAGRGRDNARLAGNDLTERWGAAMRRVSEGTPERLLSFNPIPEGEVVHGRNSADENTRIMRAAKPEGGDGEFLAAAGGWECGAPEVLAGIEYCGRTDRPIGSQIGSFTARGKALYHHQVGLDEVLDGGTAIWTEAQDLAVDPDDSATWKPCYDMACVDPTESLPVAIPMCFNVGVGQDWVGPEQVAATLAKFDVALARRSESAILQRLHEQSNQYTYTPPVNESVTNTTIRLVGQLLQMAGYNGRNSTDGYSVIVPDALLLQMIIDSKLKAWVGPTLTRAQIISQLEDAFNVRVLSTIDGRSGDGTATGEVPPPTDVIPAAPLPAGGALPCPHTRFEVIVADLNDFRVGVHEVSLDVRTSIDQARQNRRSVFSESFLTTEKLGCKYSFSVLIDDALVSGGQPDLTALDTAYCAGPIPAPYDDFPGTPLG